MDEVTIVGAGPAGATAALVLARQGVKVSLLDRSRFPRAKACAEFVSPGTSRLLQSIGLESVVTKLSELPILGFKIARGTAEICGSYRENECGFASPRTHLDTELVLAAARAGATLCEQTRAISIAQDDDGVFIDALSPKGETIQFHSRFVVGADGINSFVSHRLGLRRPERHLQRLGIVAHMEGIDDLTNLGEMHIADEYFCGIAPFNQRMANVALVVPLGAAKAATNDPPQFLAHRLRDIPSIARRFDRARFVSPIACVGPLAVSAASVWKGRIVLAGDAGGFYDPFTGQGMYRAIRGGELAAQAVVSALATGDAHRAFSDYASARRREFRGGWLVERLVQSIVARPLLLRRLMNNLERRRELVDTLVRVTGDTAPASSVLNPSYLFQAFR